MLIGLVYILDPEDFHRLKLFNQYLYYEIKTYINYSFDIKWSFFL